MRKWRRPRTVAGMMQGVKMAASPELNTEVDNRVIGTHPSFLLLSHHAQGFFFLRTLFSYFFLGYAGSSLLYELFSSCSEQASQSRGFSRGAQAVRHEGFRSCGSQA